MKRAGFSRPKSGIKRHYKENNKMYFSKAFLMVDTNEKRYKFSSEDEILGMVPSNFSKKQRAR